MFADKPLDQLLDAVAAQRPAPGGGCSAAWAAGFGAGLVEMAASFTLARPRYAGVHHRMLDVRREAAVSRRRLMELAEADAEGYEPVLKAMRMPEKHPQRKHKLEEARSHAAEMPVETAEVAAGVAVLAAETAKAGNPHLAGDAITGALLAEAACRAAAAREEALRVGEEVMR